MGNRTTALNVEGLIPSYTGGVGLKYKVLTASRSDFEGIASGNHVLRTPAESVSTCCLGGREVFRVQWFLRLVRLAVPRRPVVWVPQLGYLRFLHSNDPARAKGRDPGRP